jgi:hypothetical protein
MKTGACFGGCATTASLPSDDMAIGYKKTANGGNLFPSQEGVVRHHEKLSSDLPFCCSYVLVLTDMESVHCSERRL